MSTHAATQVFTNPTLFRHVTAFIPGVPYLVLQFRDIDFAAYVATKEPDEAEYDTLWRLAILYNNLRILSALKELSEVPAYASSRHVCFNAVLTFAFTVTKDLALINWLSDNFLEKHHRQLGIEYL